jgi:hypothetical protein
VVESELRSRDDAPQLAGSGARSNKASERREWEQHRIMQGRTSTHSSYTFKLIRCSVYGTAFIEAPLSHIGSRQNM